MLLDITFKYCLTVLFVKYDENLTIHIFTGFRKREEEKYNVTVIHEVQDDLTIR